MPIQSKSIAGGNAPNKKDFFPAGAIRENEEKGVTANARHLFL
jgi:hypothetical protein